MQAGGPVPLLPMQPFGISWPVAVSRTNTTTER